MILRTFQIAMRAETPRFFTVTRVRRDLASPQALMGADYADAHLAPEEAGMAAERRRAHYDPASDRRRVGW